MSTERSPIAAAARAATLRVASGLVPLKRRRGMIKASCTRMKTFISGVRNLDAEMRAQLEERRARLDALWSDYCDIQTDRND